MRQASLTAGGRMSGFTLVEVLIGLTLLGLVLVMIYSGLHTTSRSWLAGDRQAAINDDRRLTVGFIRQRIIQALPINHLSEGGNQVIFRGRRDSMHFVSRLPAHRGGSDLYLVAFRLAEEGSNLDFAYRPLHPDRELFSLDGEEVKHHTLLEKVSAIELAYYGSETPEDEPGWHDEWDEKTRLPTLVRFRIVQDEAGGGPEELYIRLPARVERGQPQMVLIGSETP